LLAHIRAQILSSRLHGEGYRKIWARLRHAGIRTSARRVRRLMRQHGLLAPHRVGRPTGRAHDGTITTTAVDVMWGTDMTETVTLAEGRARVFVAVDHCSGECVGIHAAASGNRFEALEPSLRRPRQCREPARACSAIRRYCRRGRAGAGAAPRPRLELHGARCPGRDPLLRH
jgi:transposase InsO family protein